MSQVKANRCSENIEFRVENGKTRAPTTAFQADISPQRQANVIALYASSRNCPLWGVEPKNLIRAISSPSQYRGSIAENVCWAEAHPVVNSVDSRRVKTASTPAPPRNQHPLLVHFEPNHRRPPNWS